MKPIIDISHHQDPAKIDYDKLVANTSGVILRAAYGAQADRHLDTHYYEIAIKRKHPVGTYHFITQYHSIQSQVDRLRTAIDGKVFQMKLWTDVERENGAEPLQRQQVINYINAVEKQIGHIEGIYTSKTQWAAIMGGVYFADKKLWAALFGTNIYNWLPQGWADYWLWQYTSQGAVDGYTGNLDMNRFRFDEAAFKEWIGGGAPDPEPEPELPGVVLYQARAIAPANLRVRSGPGISYPESAPSMVYGTIIDVYENVNGWHRHNKGGWSDGQWLERIDDEPEPPVTINTPYYGALYQQRDPRWKDKALGTSGTIGAYGCAMVSETNCLNYLGINTNPMANNAWRTANGGYRNGNLIEWGKVSEQYPEIVWEGRTFNPTDKQMLAKIESGCALVILVDHNEATSGLDEHWVCSVYRGDGQLWIFDPWDGVLIRLRDRYKKGIQQFTSYRKK